MARTCTYTRSDIPAMLNALRTARSYMTRRHHVTYLCEALEHVKLRSTLRCEKRGCDLAKSLVMHMLWPYHRFNVWWTMKNNLHMDIKHQRSERLRWIDQIIKDLEGYYNNIPDHPAPF